MSKIINAATNEANEKLVEIKHMRTMQDADGNEVQVIDWTDKVPVADALEQAEAQKVSFEARLADVNKEIDDLIAIRDAE